MVILIGSLLFTLIICSMREALFSTNISLKIFIGLTRSLLLESFLIAALALSITIWFVFDVSMKVVRM